MYELRTLRLLLSPQPSLFAISYILGTGIYMYAIGSRYLGSKHRHVVSLLATGNKEIKLWLVGVQFGGNVSYGHSSPACRFAPDILPNGDTFGGQMGAANGSEAVSIISAGV